MTTTGNTDTNDPCDYNAVDQRYNLVLLGLLLTVMVTVIRMVLIRSFGSDSSR
ncbi:MAG: hypothetical protein IPN46_12645 [Saprospiraceae bacterium]|nr:hypothetical protein [Saprospiraceae bacterium]